MAKAQGSLLELPSPAKQAVSKDIINNRLKDLLHMVEGAKGRWHRWQRLGASDEVLKQAIATELGIFSGSTRPGVIDICGRGGKSPRVWIGHCSPLGKPTLSGKQLVRRVRDLMQIPYPIGKGKRGEFVVGQEVWVLGHPDELPGQRPIKIWAKGIIQDFEGDRLRIAVAQRRYECSGRHLPLEQRATYQAQMHRSPIDRYDACFRLDEVFSKLPDWAACIPFQEHIGIIENTLLRDLNQAMQEADAERLAVLEEQELALIAAVSYWAETKGWRLVGKNGRWKCCPLRGQSRQFMPTLRSGDEAIANPVDFRQVFVRREGQFVETPQPVQLTLWGAL